MFIQSSVLSMLTFMRNIPLVRRLLIAFTLVTVIPGTILVSLGIFYINALNTRSSAIKTNLTAQHAATDQQATLNRMNALLQIRFAQTFAHAGKAVPQNDTTLNASINLVASELSQSEITFSRNLQTYSQNFDIATSSNMANVRNILLSNDLKTPLINQQDQTLHLVQTQQWVAYQKSQDKVLDLLQPPADSKGNALPPDYKTAYQALSNANNAYIPLNDSWSLIVENATTVSTTVATINSPSFAIPLAAYTIIALILAILIIIGAGYIVDRTVTHPLRQLVTLTQRIAHGETDARAEIQGSDEISAVASSINNMLEHIVRLTHETQDSYKQLQTQIAKLASEMSSLGTGDLTIQADTTIDDLGAFAESFNYVAQEFGNVVVRVKTLGKEVNTATTLSFEHITQLAQISAQQNQQIVAATTKIGEMATSSKNASKRTQLLPDIMNKARHALQDGHISSKKSITIINRTSQNTHITSNKVQGLGERSREIGDIAKAISSIAHQTNRLALEASIQAAMAGENSQGFATIATDIRNLAERTKEQTLMIGHIADAVLEDINSVVRSMEDIERETMTASNLVQEVDQALDPLFAVAEQQAKEIATINRVTRQQLESSNAIVKIMQNVSDSTRQSNSTIYETSRITQHISLLSEQLHNSVHMFKLRESHIQQGTGQIHHSSLGLKRIDRGGLNSSQQPGVGPTTQPLHHELPPSTDQLVPSPSTPYPLSPLPATPTSPIQ